MVLVGKLSTEDKIKAPATKFYNLFASQIHQVQNLTEKVHETKLHQGEDWNDFDSVKHWTYVIDGKVQTCYQSIEEVDEKNKKLIFKLHGGDIDKNFKVFKLIVEVIEKGDAIKWTVEFEKINENIETPNGWMKLLSESTRDIDAKLAKA